MVEVKKAKNTLRIYSLFAFLSIVFAIIWMIAGILYHKGGNDGTAKVLTIIGFVLTVASIFMTISFAISSITLNLVADGRKPHIVVPLCVIIITFIVSDLIWMVQEPFDTIPFLAILMVGCLYSTISGLVLAHKVV